LIDFAVGFLELILELAKILSFSFRLFGNVFGGAALLAIIGSLLPVVLPPFLYLFEMLFGIIQAYVFYLLATVFISMATVSHHGDEAAEHQ
jgi:F-type H+-transporting ATPase subunit a